MRDTVRAGAPFIVRMQDMPRRPPRVGRLQHPVTSSRVFKPSAARRQVHRAELPLAQWVGDPRFEPPSLLLVADFKPELAELDSGVHDEFLHQRAEFEKIPMLLLGAEPTGRHAG